MKKIAIDMSHYNKMGGYGVVATNIINNLLLSDDFDFYLLTLTNVELPNDLKNKKNIHIIGTDHVPYFWYRLIVQGNLLKKYHIDTFYTPDQIVPLRKVCKYISTIHDLWFYKSYSGFNIFKLLKRKDHLFWYQLAHLDKIFAKLSDYIITPSVASKHDIIEVFNVNEKKIIKVNRGMDHMVDISDNTGKYKDRNYILFPLCADIENHFIFRLGDRILRESLVDEIIYRKPGSNEGDKIPNFTTKNVKIINHRISEEDKISLYKNSRLCVYVSEFEGFGFVPLECLWYKSPLVYHKIGSLDEVVGDGGIGINDCYVDSYIKAIKRLLKNKEFYVKIGTEKVRKYSWYNTVQEIVKIGF